jgi:hypothetical protein
MLTSIIYIYIHIYIYIYIIIDNYRVYFCGELNNRVQNLFISFSIAQDDKLGNNTGSGF